MLKYHSDHKIWLKLILMFALTSLAACNCPPQQMKSFGRCAYHIHCYGNIRNISLPEDCREATNYPVTVTLMLSDPIETLDEEVDIDFLPYITTYKVSGLFTDKTNKKLNYLQHANRLQQLYLDNNNIESFVGAPFFYLNSIEVLNLAHNRISQIDNLFEFDLQPNRLKKLSLAYNVIEELPGDAFAELSSLVELDLSHNIISDLTEEPFSNLTKLEILRLNNNRLKNLNGAVNELHGLKHLYLRGNQIQNIDEQSLKIIKHLETFDLSSNDLEYIKPIMLSRHWDHIGNHSVCKIILSDNHITNIPSATSKEISSRYVRDSNKHIVDIETNLDLSGNLISTIEYNAFQSLIQLISLDLSRNKIIDFVVNSNDLTYVKSLNLSGNYISHLYYDSFASMKHLENLDLSFNNLDFIPDMTFNNNNNLKFVNMTYNDLENLDRIQITMFHPKGGVLDLSNNGLFKIKIPYGEGLRLVTLKLHSNNVSDPSLIDLHTQKDLKDIDLSYNIIWGLEATSLRLPSSLENLDLSWNRIQFVKPSSFHMLKHLKTLRLRHNYLSNIEYASFSGLPNLLNLDLGYNTIGNLDSKMLMDLKKLEFLSLISNGLNILELKSWYGHQYNLNVVIDNNNLTCEWLAKALSDYNNGYTKVRPTVLVPIKAAHSVEDIPCISEKLADYTAVGSQYVMADERLLSISHKILEAVLEQNEYFRKFILLSLLQEKVNSSENLNKGVN